MAGGHFDNQVYGSAALADGTVIGIAPNAVASAVAGMPAVETAKSPDLHYDSSVPLPFGNPTRSTWQSDLIAIRVRARAAWAVTASGGVQTLQNVNW